MELSQFETFLTTISFLTLYVLLAVFAIHFIFRKNLVVRNFVYLGFLAIGLLVSYYNTIFKGGNSWFQSILFTVVFIGLVRQQLIYKKKMNK